MGIYDRALFQGAKHAAPMYRNYIDILAGHQGKLKSMLGWGATIEGGLYAADSLYPTKTYEPLDQATVPSDRQEQLDIEPSKPEKIKSIKITNDPNNAKNKNYTAETKDYEETQGGEGDSEKGAAVTAASDDPNLVVDNDSITRINKYKDVMNEVLGQSAGGDQMQKSAMLMQLGAALMSGKTNQPGVSGFFEVVGQAAGQTAPMLFQMGVEKGKADRELTAAAMEMYFKEMENSETSGPYVWVYKNNYKTAEDGTTLLRDENNNFIPAGPPTKVRQVRRTSPEEKYYYGLNNDLGYDAFTFIEAGEGTDALNMAGGQGGGATMPTDASQADQRKYGMYLQRGIKELAEVVMPTIINNQHLIGVQGELGRKFGPLAELVEQAANDGEFDKRYQTMVKDIINNEFGESLLIIKTNTVKIIFATI